MKLCNIIIFMDNRTATTLQAKGASAGIAIGKVFLFQKDEIIVEIHDIEESQVEHELGRLDKAIECSKEEILALKDKLDAEAQTDVGEILKAHIQLLEDRSVLSQVREEVRRTKKNVEFVYNSVVLDFVEKLRAIQNNLFTERAHDIIDIRNRVLRNLVKRDVATPSDVKEPVIIVAHNLTPSDTLNLPREYIQAFAIDVGGTTSHTAILSRSLGIPAVVGLKNISALVNNGDTIIVDGIRGTVIINPSEDIISEYHAMGDMFDQLQKDHMRFIGLPASTLDGKVIKMEGNIELPDETDDVKRFGAEGIGLYRTEFMYIDQDRFPREDEQFNNYKKVVESMEGKPVTIRTLDLGGDKFLNKDYGTGDENPFLGWRAIRFCLANPHIFRVQLRAILRASVYGSVNIMFPMISTIEEFEQAAGLFREECERLKLVGAKVPDDIKLGVMIETPSAAITSDVFAKQVDFFSIGTNDLIQYTLACDRTNEKISYLYDPLNVAVLSLIKTTADNAHANNIPIAMCGEMSGEPLYAPILVGLGIDVLSMSPSLIPEMKKVLRGLNAAECKDFTDRLLTFRKSVDLRRELVAYMKEKFPDIMASKY